MHTFAGFRTSCLAIVACIAMGSSGACSANEPPPQESGPEAHATAISVALPDDLTAATGQDVVVNGLNVVFVHQGAELEIPYFIARLRPHGDLVDLEDPASYEIYVETLQLRISHDSIASVFRHGDGPVHRAEVHAIGEQIEIAGTLDAPRLPFKFSATPAVTESGRLRLDLDKVRVLGIGLKPFMGLLEKKIAARPGLIVMQDDVVYLDPFPTTGPPMVHAEFTSVEVTDDGIVATLSDIESPRDLPTGVTLSGGALRSGRSILIDTTLHLVPENGEGELRILSGRLGEQIRAGFTKQRPEFTIEIHVASLESELSAP